MVRKASSMEEAVTGVGDVDVFDVPPVRSPLLLAFLEEWLAWAKLPSHADTYSFRRCDGLCGCLLRWMHERNVTVVHPLGGLVFELKCTFMTGGYDTSYPFGADNYRDRIYLESQHSDPLRLRWVEKTIAATKYEMSRPTSL